MAPEKAPRRLGRGLDALLGQKPITPPSSPPPPQEVSGGAEESGLREIPLSSICANQYQPRKTFNPEELAELRESIRVSGLLQPITVRQLSARTESGHPKYELVAGERRFRAVQELKWTTIPAIVRDYDDRTMLTLALIENLQREDLNPIEEAEGFARLAKEFQLSHSEIAELVGKDRSTVANFLRILQLPPQVRDMLKSGELTMGHARPLLALEDEELITQLANEIVRLGLSVRAVEERVRQEAPQPTKPKRGRPPRQDTRSAEVKYVEDLLRKRLQTDVSVAIKKGQQGELKIQFYSYDDLNRLLELMNALE
jgi:ParB family chromosome partitioning protein